jgi:hypothetical protein
MYGYVLLMRSLSSRRSLSLKNKNVKVNIIYIKDEWIL